MLYAIIIFASFFVLRLFSLAFSIRNEKRLIKCGATQYGKRNSLLLTLAHIAYYFGALYEGYTSNMEFDRTSVICLLYTSPSPRDRTRSRMPSSA